MQLPTLAPCLVVLALLAVAWPGHAFPHDHGHEGGEAAAAGHVVATPAQRWTTDAPLRAGMRDIRNVVEALGHYEHGHIGEDQAVLLARQVQGHIGGIVANCRLEPEADAALHVVLASRAQGANAGRQRESAARCPRRVAPCREPLDASGHCGDLTDLPRCACLR